MSYFFEAKCFTAPVQNTELHIFLKFCRKLTMFKK